MLKQSAGLLEVANALQTLDTGKILSASAGIAVFEEIPAGLRIEDIAENVIHKESFQVPGG